MGDDSGFRESILQAALSLIDSGGGAAGVGVRQIARMTGCSAPNVYNHFAGIEDLRAEALLRISAEYGARVARAMRGAKARNDPFGAAVRAFLRFATDHPGWLYFYLFEKGSAPAQQSVRLDAKARGSEMGAIVRAASGGALAADSVPVVTEAIYRYLVGTVSEFLTGKAEVRSKKAFVERAAASSRIVFDALVEKLATRKRGGRGESGPS
jgi:AcrR family transcriptional regulator